MASTDRNKAEKDHPDNLSLAGDGFDTVIKAKAAVDAVRTCRNKVSCADILALATRDVIVLVCIVFFLLLICFFNRLVKLSTALSVSMKLLRSEKWCSLAGPITVWNWGGWMD